MFLSMNLLLSILNLFIIQIVEKTFEISFNKFMSFIIEVREEFAI